MAWATYNDEGEAGHSLRQVRALETYNMPLASDGNVGSYFKYRNNVPSQVRMARGSKGEAKIHHRCYAQGDQSRDQGSVGDAISPREIQRGGVLEEEDDAANHEDQGEPLEGARLDRVWIIELGAHNSEANHDTKVTGMSQAFEDAVRGKANIVHGNLAWKRLAGRTLDPFTGPYTR